MSRLCLVIATLLTINAYDTQLVSYDAVDCPSDGLHYEISVASGSCVHLGGRLAMAVECGLDNAISRRYWRGYGEQAECRGPPEQIYELDEPVCVESRIFGGKSYTQVCHNSETTAYGVRIEYFASFDDCDDELRTFGATMVPHSCYNIRMDATTSFKYHCEDNATINLEKWVDHDRCGGPLEDEFVVPSGACLPGGHEGNAYETIAVRYTCDGHEPSAAALAAWDGEGKRPGAGTRDAAWWAESDDDDDGGRHARENRTLRVLLGLAVAAVVAVALCCGCHAAKERARTKQLVRAVQEQLNDEGLIMQQDGTLVAAAHRGVITAQATEVVGDYAKGEYAPDGGIELPATPTSPAGGDFDKAAPPTAQVIPTL